MSNCFSNKYNLLGTMHKANIIFKKAIKRETPDLLKIMPLGFLLYI